MWDHKNAQDNGVEKFFYDNRDDAFCIAVGFYPVTIHLENFADFKWYKSTDESGFKVNLEKTVGVDKIF